MRCVYITVEGTVALLRSILLLALLLSIDVGATEGHLKLGRRWAEVEEAGRATHLLRLKAEVSRARCLHICYQAMAVQCDAH